MNFVKPEIISLKGSSEYNEKWLQKIIEDDPSILGLGDLDFRDTEKVLVGGGRLDTILYDPEYKKRYEVEIQLGKTDESHIIRTIEYWDIERKRNPQYEHCAVIIAEDITSRFLNVISLFNGFIPLIAIQVKAVRIGDAISLFFTKILDESTFELHDEDTETESTDESYWENKSTKTSVQLVKKTMASLGQVVADYQLKFNKHYIGIAKNNVARNFIAFRPRKNTVIFHARIEKSEDIDELIEGSDLDTLAYDKQWNQYRIRITKNDLESNMEVLTQLAQRAHDEYMS